jgi:hypothetical protein
MSTSPSVFPFAHIALTAAITAGVAFLLLVTLRARFKVLSLVDCLLVAVVVGISVLVWRSAGNTGALNNASYRCRAFRAGTGAAHPVSFVINVVTI